MALSLAAGVTIATVLPLVLIPSLLAIINDFRRAGVRLKTDFWPTREEVEPAAHRRVDQMVVVWHVYEWPLCGIKSLSG